MGYTTDFYGEFQISPPLEPAQVAYLQAFNRTRRMARRGDLAGALDDPLRDAVGLPVGKFGEYYVGSVSDGNFGQSNDPSVLDHNTPPGVPVYRTEFGEYDGEEWQPCEGGEQRPHMQYGDHTHCAESRRVLVALGHQPQNQQPGLWCQWTVNDEGTLLMWDQGEKFYHYIEWLHYLYVHFLDRWERTLIGTVEWQGEEPEDYGRIECEVIGGKQRITFANGIQKYGESQEVTA